MLRKLNFLQIMAMILNNKGEVDSGGEGGSDKETVYPEGLDKEYHGNKTLLKYVDKETGQFKNDQVFKALIHASSQLGSEKMVVPNDKFTPDQWKDTYRKLGLPDLDKYELANNLAEGQKDSGLHDGFRAKAHELGILPSQAQGLFDYINVSNNEISVNRNQEMSNKMNVEVEALKVKWGDKYDNNVAMAERGIRQFASEEELVKLQELGVMDSPLMTEMFNRIGAGLLEDKFDPIVKGVVGSSPEEIQDKIKSFYEKDHPFMNKRHPQNAFYKAEYMRMMEQLHGKKKIGVR